MIGIKSVNDDDQLLLMTSRGKIQRIKVADIGIIGRNTQGVRIMGLDKDDSLSVIARVPRDELEEDDGEGEAPVKDDSPVAPADPASTAKTPEADDSEGTTPAEDKPAEGDESESDSEA